MSDYDYDDDPTEALRDADELALRQINRPGFTCNTCQAEGSAHWLARHDCSHNQYVNENGGRCEDYPCCGHTDGDGCRTLESHSKDYWTDWMTDRMNAGYDLDEVSDMMDRMDY